MVDATLLLIFRKFDIAILLTLIRLAQDFSAMERHVVKTLLRVHGLVA